LYAKRFEDLPIIQRFGDIIRVHRATLRIYKNHRQFNVNIFYNSSWALFSIKTEASSSSYKIKKEEELTPFAHSDKRFTFIKNDADRVKNIKNWAYQYFTL
jgi:hypothetical protein